MVLSSPFQRFLELIVQVKGLDSNDLISSKAAGIISTLTIKGPFTVFAPINEAFEKLPPDTLNAFLLPENRMRLTSLLTYHVLPGRYSSIDLLSKIKAADGKLNLQTIFGGDLNFKLVGEKIIVSDSNGVEANITSQDLNVSNDVVHAIDTVFLPS